MMNIAHKLSITLCLALAVQAADEAHSGTGYRAAVETWRQDRERSLKADGGWLTVTGLFWLKEGSNTLGSGPDNDVVLPASAPPNLGALEIHQGAVRFTTAAQGVTLNGKPVTRSAIQYSGPVDVLSSGPLDLLVLKRGERFALRLKDKNSGLRKNFTHLSWYPVQDDWRVTAKFTALPQPEKLTVDTIIGEQESMSTPGYVEFQKNGQTYRLQAVSQGKGLFFIIRDLTSGKTTYAASRFLYTEAPKADGTVVLDFNRAQNPPCAFTPYATCPLPPAQNRLKLAIEAGEQKYEGSTH